MKIALTVWNERIAPVFDVAGRILIFEVSDKQQTGEISAVLPSESAEAKIKFLTELKVDELICGAISCQVRLFAEASGIKVYGFIAGNYRKIIVAWCQNRLENGEYAMPGCNKRRRCCRRGNNQA
ncbi:MAG: hypothetical protein PHO45_04925 [Victivallaceae bacterium]|nr:hypothetical protein [Victivallaceae bacterium]